MTFPILPSNSATGGYQTQRSLRFNSADSAYLNRTPASAGSLTTWTWSGWVKRGVLSSYQRIFSTTSNASQFFLRFDNTNTLLCETASSTVVLNTTQVFRDPSAWYHIVFTWDTTNATASDRVRLYINGIRVTAFATINNPALNATSSFNAAVVHYIGGALTVEPFNGYLTEVNFIDGQALTPSSFGETNATTGQWQPKRYTGTYGTNGFYLNFSDNSGTTATTLGKDYSGNGNNWTPNNFSVTPGAGNDSMIDVPTNWADGGNGRGNYCTLNPLKSTKAPTNGNLDFTGAGGAFVDSIYGTIGVSTSGKYYFEVTGGFLTGVNRIDINPSINQSTGRIVYHAAVGGIYNESTVIQSGLPTATSTDVISVAINLDAGTLAFYKNNVQLGSNVSISATDTWWPFLQNPDVFPGHTNFGQRPFAYTPPSGFKALNTQNLPSPTIAKGNTQFNPVLFNKSSFPATITGVGFQPDFTWWKSRDVAGSNFVFDVQRGASNFLITNTTAAADTQPNAWVTNSDGWTSASGAFFLNGNYVAWNWKANGTGVTNTAGTITSTVSANTTAGFSVVTYTGTGANATVGHGLGVAPRMVIVKSRTQGTTGYTGNWAVWHTAIANTEYLLLNTTDAKATGANYWNSTSPTSSVISIGTAGLVNTNTHNFVAYCFAAIPGYSAFGSYTGNGSADGPFVYCGFRPRWILIKTASSTASVTGDWWLWDSVRSTYNAANSILYPNGSYAEYTGSIFDVDILSNGFKSRSTNTIVNGSTQTYIYAAFAESPFKFANAR